jgi:hypothetical protein
MIAKLLGITLSTLALLVAGLESTAKGAEFSCQDRVLIDYAQALERMPGDRLPGENLPFAPRDLKLRPARSVVVEGEPVSYTLSLKRPIAGNGDLVRPAQLGWVITMKSYSVDQSGRSLALVRERRWRVGKLRRPERPLDVRVDPGLYRVSVKIQKFGGPILASYHQFIRVLPRRQDLNIAIRGDSIFQPGETVVGRIENRGTVEALLSTGSGLAVERRVGESWERVEHAESPSVQFEDPEFLPGGRASRCSLFTIPTESVSGAYRFSALVETRFGKQRKIIGQFAVS